MVLVHLWWRDGGGAVIMVVSVEGDSHGGDGDGGVVVRCGSEVVMMGGGWWRRGLDLSKLAIILNRPIKIYSKGLTSGDDNDGDHPKTSNNSPPAMKMEQYLSHTDYPTWQVIHNGNGPIFVTTYINGIIKVLPPKTAEEVVARERERKARTTLLMALPENYLAKFHKMADAKEM
nr:xylulose kinase-1 [Tanacetum cinerariifolium]